MSSSDTNTESTTFSEDSETILSTESTEEKPEHALSNHDSLEYELPEYEFTKEEEKSLCKAFTLLDEDGDGVMEKPDIEKLLLAWGRMPIDKDLKDIMNFAKGTGCEGAKGMDFKSFRNYMKTQLANTSDEDELRKAFEVFDSDPPTGELNLTELRHFLKRKGMKLNDDEIDYLFREEDYWMLKEKNIFEYQQLIDKILDKPTCSSPFLFC